MQNFILSSFYKLFLWFQETLYSVVLNLRKKIKSQEEETDDKSDDQLGEKSK
jgi:hypothetical protein